jgi:hypothetical protein
MGWRELLLVETFKAVLTACTTSSRNGIEFHRLTSQCSYVSHDAKQTAVNCKEIIDCFLFVMEILCNFRAVQTKFLTGPSGEFRKIYIEKFNSIIGSLKKSLGQVNTGM